MLSRNCLPVRRTWVHPRFLARFAGTDPGYQVRGRGARKLLRYFVWKITILRHKILFFPILGRGDPPLLRVPQSFVFCVMFGRSMFVILSFSFCPLCCLSFFDLRFLMVSLVSSNFVFCFAVCLYLYCRWWINYQRGILSPLPVLPHHILCVSPKTGHGFPLHMSIFLRMDDLLSICWYWWIYCPSLL